MITNNHLNISGILIILVGPSGVGKTTLVNKVTDYFPDIVHIPTITTRAPRKKENSKNPPIFVSSSKFDEFIEEEEFIEWQVLHGNRYGTPKKILMQLLKEGKDCILNIDVLGAVTIKKTLGDVVKIILIAPPNIELLVQRLKKDKKRYPDDISARLKRTLFELLFYQRCDYIIINEDLDFATHQLIEIILAQRKIRNLILSMGETTAKNKDDQFSNHLKLVRNKFIEELNSGYIEIYIRLFSSYHHDTVTDILSERNNDFITKLIHLSNIFICQEVILGQYNNYIEGEVNIDRHSILWQFYPEGRLIFLAKIGDLAEIKNSIDIQSKGYFLGTNKLLSFINYIFAFASFWSNNTLADYLTISIYIDCFQDDVFLLNDTYKINEVQEITPFQGKISCELEIPSIDLQMNYKELTLKPMIEIFRHFGWSVKLDSFRKIQNDISQK